MLMIAVGHAVIVSAFVMLTLKTFSLTVVSIFLNCGPFLTVLICAIFI